MSFSKLKFRREGDYAGVFFPPPTRREIDEDQLTRSLEILESHGFTKFVSSYEAFSDHLMEKVLRPIENIGSAFSFQSLDLDDIAFSLIKLAAALERRAPQSEIAEIALTIGIKYSSFVARQWEAAIGRGEQQMQFDILREESSKKERPSDEKLRAAVSQAAIEFPGKQKTKRRKFIADTLRMSVGTLDKIYRE